MFQAPSSGHGEGKTTKTEVVEILLSAPLSQCVLSDCFLADLCEYYKTVGGLTDLLVQTDNTPWS